MQRSLEKNLGNANILLLYADPGDDGERLPTRNSTDNVYLHFTRTPLLSFLQNPIHLKGLLGYIR